MLNKLNFMSNFGARVFLPSVFRPIFEVVVRKKKKLPPLRGHGGFAPFKLGCSDFSRQKHTKNKKQAAKTRAQHTQ